MGANSATPNAAIKPDMPNRSQETTLLQDLRVKLIEMYTLDPMRRFNRLMAGVSATLLLLIPVLLPVAHLRITPFLSALYAPFLVGFIIIVVVHELDYPRLRDAGMLFFWALVIAVCISSLLYIAARSPAPLCDAALAGIDHRMGLEATFFVHAASLHPRVAGVLAVSYLGFLPLLMVALTLPVAEGLREPPQRLVISYTVAALITVVLFAMFPAVGPWTVYPLKPFREQLLTQTTPRTFHHDHVD
jgi:hypothetical protein